MNLIFGILAFIVAFPPIATFILFRVVRRPLKSRRRAVQFAAEWTVPLYMIAVTYMLSGIVDHKMGGWMFVLILLIFSLLLIRQVRRNDELVIGALAKKFLRRSFPIFFILYFVFVIVSILQYIF